MPHECLLPSFHDLSLSQAGTSRIGMGTAWQFVLHLSVRTFYYERRVSLCSPREDYGFKKLKRPDSDLKGTVSESRRSVATHS